MPSLGARARPRGTRGGRGAVGPEIRVEVLRQLVFEMCLLFRARSLSETLDFIIILSIDFL